MSADVVVEVDGLTKRFTIRERAGVLRRSRREVTAVDGVGFSVERGQLVGYLGPNGAGKSTTIKMLTGILTPTSGDIDVLGHVPVRERRELARRIGVVFGQRSQLWWDLPLADSFELLHHVYRTDLGRHRARRDELVELLDIGRQMSTPVRQLSLGQRMRGELIAALLHEPELVVLDEPTIGLDVVSKDRVRQFLTKVNSEEGTTVILTTHDLGDVERLCERLLIIDEGHVIWDGALDEFRSHHAPKRTVVADLEPGSVDPAVPGAPVVRREGDRCWLEFDRTALTAAAVIGQLTAQVAVRDLSVEEADIEDLVRDVYRTSE